MPVTTEVGSNTNIIKEYSNMKKILLSMMAVAALLTACDPAEDSYSNNAKDIAQGDLAGIVTFVQADENGNAQADGNYFTFTTSPATVVDIYTVSDDGSENLLSHGTASGSFKYAPRRGADPNQTLYIRAMNADGSTVMASKQVTVFVPSELAPEMRLLASNAYGEKTWMWDAGGDSDAGDGRCWGNMGSPGSGDGFIGGYIWWGVSDAADLAGQLGHSVTGQAIGEEDNDARMVIAEDGSVKCYDKDGNVIRSGKVQIRDWDPSNTWQVGTLHTTEGATLFPFEINAGGRYVTDYEIHKLTADKLVLVYPDNGKWDGWSEGTYWCFKSNTDADGMLTNYEGKSWTWDAGGDSDAGGGRCWGNMGSPGSGDGFIGGYIWWGVSDAAELADQLGHSVTGKAIGEEDNAAYMTFNGDAVKCYDGSGKEIRSGKFEVQGWDPTNTWKVGTLHTTEGATLFPFEINAGGRYVTDYEIHKLTADKLVLVYPDNGKWDGWSEGTYWCFKAK